MTPKNSPVYVVLVGCNYEGARHEPDELVNDVPARVVRAWLDEGVIRKATAKERKAGHPLPPEDDDGTDDEGGDD